MRNLFTLYGKSRVRVGFAPTWFFGYQHVRQYLPVGKGGSVIQLFIVPFIVVSITI